MQKNNKLAPEKIKRSKSRSLALQSASSLALASTSDILSSSWDNLISIPTIREPCKELVSLKVFY